MLGVYSRRFRAPSSLLRVTPSTPINSAEGWQTITLTSPLTVASGQMVWLSWVFETDHNPGVRYVASGCPEITCSAAQSSASWTGSMPATFGASTPKWNYYSLYCTYTRGAVGIGNPSDNLLDINSNMSDKENVLIYPNPTDGSVTVTWDKNYDSRLILTIYNSQGSPVKKVEVEPSINQIQVDLNNNLNGLYLLELRDMNGIIINRSRIVKR